MSLRIPRTIERLERLRRAGAGNVVSNFARSFWAIADTRPDVRSAFGTPDDVDLREHVASLTSTELQAGLTRLRRFTEDSYSEGSDPCAD